VLLALLGVLSFIVGLYALRNVLVTIAALALLLGIFWIVNGAMEVFTALSHRGMQGRGWTSFMGLLGVVAGVVVLVYPGISPATPPPAWPRPPERRRRRRSRRPGTAGQGWAGWCSRTRSSHSPIKAVNSPTCSWGSPWPARSSTAKVARG
jgi:hypothetical protein